MTTPNKQSNTESMQVLADQMADYMWQKHFAPKLANIVRYYRAEVTEAASNGKIGIKQPYETSTTYLPYVTSASGLTVGQQCTVLVFGGSSNAMIIGDGTLTNW